MKKVPEAVVRFSGEHGYPIFGVYELKGWWIFKTWAIVQRYFISEHGFRPAEEKAYWFAQQLNAYYRRQA